jgi:uncharacterized RDD family membrane protein YckC
LAKNKPETLTLRGYYAGFASRLMAIVIDVLILAIVLAIAGILWFIIIESVNIVFQSLTGASVTLEGIRLAMVVVVTVVSFATYYIFLWTAIGTTIGGLVIGTRVVNKEGKNPSFLQSAARFLIEFGIPFFFIFGSLWIPFNRQRRALYDRVAGTFVIYDWDAKPDEIFLKEFTKQVSDRNKKE